MRHVSLSDLEIFAAIARTRSFRRAAIERGVSASALSQAMRNLEDRLGTRLLNRTTRSVAPTAAGEQLLSRLGPAFSEIAQAVDHVNAFRQTPAGTVRINAPQPAVEYCLRPLFKPFLEAYPEIKLEVIADAALVDIVKEGFDAGVRFGEEMAQDMVAVPLGPSQRYVVVGSSRYLAKHGTPRQPKELLGHSCIRHRFPGGTIFSWDFKKAGKSVTIVPEGSLTVNDGHHAVRGAIDGIGLARVLEDYVRLPLAAGEVEEVLRDWSARIPGWFLYYPSRRYVPAAMRAFLNFIAQRNPGHDR
jgi:DNA-binding transcriptional LysR family regulator